MLAKCMRAALVILVSACWVVAANAQMAGKPVGLGDADLTIAEDASSPAIIVVAPNAGPNEKAAAADLGKYIQIMTGAKLDVANTEATVASAIQGHRPLLLVGSAAIKAMPKLAQDLERVAKKNPTLRADAIVLKREGNRVYMAGNNDDAHYYAVARLLYLWGCRWFLPSDFGECIPEYPAITVGKLDEAYGSPFEMRGYWISWNGEQKYAPEFRLRNMMNDVQVSGGHALGQFTQSVIPPGKTQMDIPIADDKTAQAVANHPVVEKHFAAGEDFSLGMEDGTYTTDSKRDLELQAGLRDKYFLTATLTDNFMEFYNKVCAILLQKHPNSKSHIGFLAYSNITIPPQRQIIAAKPLVASLAPIDTDPNHGMDDQRSPARQEYGQMMARWSQVMEGRVFIYDYDQGMLVWRDLPNPSIAALRQDVHHYLKAGILGVNTECRNAIATVFLNLYVRGQVLWNPDTNIDALLADFYPRFYGPAAGPMAKYWGAIYKAWDDTIVTEHEYFVIPAIYTPELVTQLRTHLEEAEAAMKAAAANPTHPRDWQKYQDRMKFTRLSFNLIDQYTGAFRAAATECDYRKAVELGDKAAATRLELGNMNTTFTTRIIPSMPVPETKDNGPAWLLGEIEQYRKLQPFVDGTKGRLVAKLPVEWSYHRDPHETGLVSGWAYRPVDLTYWRSHAKDLTGFARKDYPTTQWEMLRTDLYAQAQGVLHPDGQSFTGFHWYRTEVELAKAQVGPAKKIHIRFPGIFNTGWLYVNGYLVAYRPQGGMWWLNDYAFEWDADLTGKLLPGKNTITVRLENPHHFGGMFRRPFLYEATGP